MRVQFLELDDTTGWLYADGELLPVTRVRRSRRGPSFPGGFEIFDAYFRLENGLTASLSVDSGPPAEDQILLALYLIEGDDASPQRTSGTVLRGPTCAIGFDTATVDTATVPEGEAWVVDEWHRYGMSNETCLSPASGAEIRALLRAWSGLRIVDKRTVPADL